MSAAANAMGEDDMGEGEVGPPRKGELEVGDKPTPPDANMRFLVQRVADESRSWSWKGISLSS